MAESNALAALKLILLLFLLAFTCVKAQISDKRLCADKGCKVVISKARALGKHPADHPLKLTFESGDLISITSKSAGKNPHLWGGEFDGHRGYFDKNFVKEMKVFVENPVHEVDTEGDVFENLKPPNADRHRSRPQQRNPAPDTDVANDKIEDEAKTVVLNKDKDNDERSKNARNDDGIDDLLLINDSPSDALNSDETDLSETDDFESNDKEAVDDAQDDEGKEQEDVDLDLDSWAFDVVEGSDYYGQNLNRFDTAGLNQFLKNKLLPDDPAKTDSVGSGRDSEKDTLRVKPDIPEEINMAAARGQQKHEPASRSKDVHTMNVADVKVPSEEAEKDLSRDTKTEKENGVDEENINSKHKNNNEGGQESNHVDSDGADQDKNHVGDDGADQDKNHVGDDGADQDKNHVDGDGGDQDENHVGDDGEAKSEPNESEIDGDEHIASDDSDFDPTEVDESSPNELEEDIAAKDKDSAEKPERGTNTDEKSESSISNANAVAEDVKDTDLEADAHSDDEEAVDGNKEQNQIKKGLSQEDINNDSSLETLESEDLKEASDKKKTQSNERNTASEERFKEKPSLDAAGSNDAAKIQEEKEADNNKADSIDEDNENGRKYFVTKNKQDTEAVDKKVSGQTNEKESSNYATVDSDVRPDTISDTLSPESSEDVNQVTAGKMKVDTELGENEEIDADRKASISDPIDQSLDQSSSQSNEQVQADSTDEDKPSGGGGFFSFLQSSRTEPEQSDLATETPKLNPNTASAFMKEKASDSATSKLNIESSKSDDNKQDATEDGEKKIDGEDGMETYVDGGSTTVLDGAGNLVTAFMLADKVTPGIDEMQSSFLPDKSSSIPIQKVNPTAVHVSSNPSALNKKDSETPFQSTENNSTGSKQIHSAERESLPDNHFVSEAYQSSDFNSRNLLSLNQPQATPQRQQQTPPTMQQQPSPTPQQVPSEGIKQQEQVSVIPTPVLSLLLTLNSDMESALPDGLAESQVSVASDATGSPSFTDQSGSDGTEEEAQQALPDQGDQSEKPQEIKSDSSTQSTVDSLEMPPTTDTGDSPPDLNEVKTPPGDYDSDSVYHSRKITDEDLISEEEQKSTEPGDGFFKRIVTALENHVKDLFGKLPSSVQSVLEPLSLNPNMKLLVGTFSVAVLISTSFISFCFSGGSNKKQQRDLLIRFDEMEKRHLVDMKEKQNLEDEITNKALQNKQMKEDVTKLTEESKKNKSELQTLHAHNDAMKKQLASFEDKISELKENASSKQGEVKQQSKKTKDMEKQIKKLEERERHLEQTAQKLTSDLKHKDEEVTLLTSKTTGLIDQVGHLQTSKDQLLAEAEDWREKVSDLKERLEQREEEFKQMQETIMFKENELEVLKDCFLQLKSFEENAEEEEDTENASARVQEKISSMMDVSRMNASLFALEEEKNSLSNKLEIEMEARRELEEQLESSRRSVESSTADKMKAERQCQEAQTKLNVLSSYFKEKEMQLQRELGEQEALKKQNLNKLVSADETTKTIQQELEFFRTQSDSLKRELASSERDFRSQIAANEKKAHENWLAARAAERELKEARHEAGVLRQKLTDIERRQFVGPGGLIRPLPTRGIPPPGALNGPPPPGMDRSPSRGSLPLLPPPHMRGEDFLNTSRGDRGPPPFPLDPRRAPGPPPGMYPLPPDARSPPPRVPPFSGGRSPPLRMPPPPGMMDGRSPPPYDRRPPPHHMLDRRSPPFHHPPSDMLPPHLRGGPLPPPHLGRMGAGSPPMGPESPRLDGRYPLPPYGRNPPPPDRPSPKQSNQTSPRQQQSQV